MARTRADQAEVHSITGVQEARSDDLDRRVNRYLVSMGIRTACVILALVVPGPARWFFAVGAVVLPYVAVIAANASGAPRTAPSAVMGDVRRRPAQLAADRSAAGDAAPRETSPLSSQMSAEQREDN